jgi:hypothetical protein
MIKTVAVIRLKKPKKEQVSPGVPEPDTPYRRKCGMTWAALIKAVFEVDPLKCPKPVVSRVEPCGGQMIIVAFIEEPPLIERSYDTHRPSSVQAARYGKKIPGRHLLLCRPSTRLSD